MKIVVDTNIIFSALLNSNNTIGDLLFNSEGYFEFYAAGYMRYEIQKHWDRIKKISKLSDLQLQISYSLIISKLQFINEEIIPIEIWLVSEKLASGIDVDDVDFVALTKFLKANLWTGDKALYKGLKKLNFKKVLNTQEMLELRTSRNEK